MLRAFRLPLLSAPARVVTAQNGHSIFLSRTDSGVKSSEPVVPNQGLLSSRGLVAANEYAHTS
ncbi:MAG: hypothetical protein V1267_10125, partial [Alphaproteobacteria bacterium]|nr:hypothetical protein [Alphaproteobacteria bacterium]